MYFWLGPSTASIKRVSRRLDAQLNKYKWTFLQLHFVFEWFAEMKIFSRLYAISKCGVIPSTKMNEKLSIVTFPIAEAYWMTFFGPSAFLLLLCQSIWAVFVWQVWFDTDFMFYSMGLFGIALPCWNVRPHNLDGLTASNSILPDTDFLSRPGWSMVGKTEQN